MVRRIVVVVASLALALGLSGEPLQARKCIRVNSEVADLQLEGVTLGGLPVTNLKAWRAGHYAIMGLKRSSDGRAVIHLFLADYQGRPLAVEQFLHERE